MSVREHNAKCGPGKHLLHAQYLHRESIYLIDDIVKVRSRGRGEGEGEGWG